MDKIYTIGIDGEAYLKWNATKRTCEVAVEENVAVRKVGSTIKLVNASDERTSIILLKSGFTILNDDDEDQSEEEDEDVPKEPMKTKRSDEDSAEKNEKNPVSNKRMRLSDDYDNNK